MQKWSTFKQWHLAGEEKLPKKIINVYIFFYLTLYSAKQHQNPFKATGESALLLSGTSFLGRKKTLLWITMRVLNSLVPFTCAYETSTRMHGCRRHVAHGSAQQSAAPLWSFFKDTEKTDVSKDATQTAAVQSVCTRSSPPHTPARSSTDPSGISICLSHKASHC